jgi:histone acetyltransferase (RNA polymerase elongator complex component)
MSFIVKTYVNSYFQDVYKIVHDTIEKIYPNYYPQEAVDFFHNYHSVENMAEDIPKGTTLIALKNNRIIGTGSIVSNEIKRMFIVTEQQYRGYGRLLLQELEKIAENNGCNEVQLDASLGSYGFYKQNGYLMIDYNMVELPNDCKLCYFRMKKYLNPGG